MKRKLLSLLIVGFIANIYADESSATIVATKSTASATKVNASAVATAKKSESSVTIADSVDCSNGTACMIVCDTSKKAIDLINKDQASQITNIIVSQFDFTLMTKYAMGNNWKLATPEQQTKLVTLFRQLLIYTYSTALSKFKGAKTYIISSTVSVPDPKKPQIQKAAVISQVTLPTSNNNAPIKVEYDLANNTGSWKAYDIKIENASLVTTYRTQFNDVVQSSKIPGLIKQLQDKVDSLQNTNKSSTTE